MKIVVDIETVAIDDADQFLEPVDAPAHYKDPEKIAAYVAEARTKARERCALDPDLCRIVALGDSDDRSGTPSVTLCRTAEEERDALQRFWRVVTINDTFVTFNGLRFDLPVLMRRSQYLRVAHPPLNLDKYRTPHLDLLDRLTFRGAIPGHSLKFYCARFGIALDDTHTGKDIGALVAAGDWAAVAAHCRADVDGTRALAQRLGVL
jgi:hypothetical protein